MNRILRIISVIKVWLSKGYDNFYKLPGSIFLTGIVFFIAFAVEAKQPEFNKKYPKIAVVLSGGGAKGFAHVGVLKVLEQEGIPVDIIVGTSMGSLIGGIYALGYTADEIENIIRQQDWETLLFDKIERKNLSFNDRYLNQRYFLSFSFSDRKSIGLPQGIIKGQNVLNTFCELSANVPVDADFGQFPISFACVATDLETEEEVILTDGFFPTALFASMAIPGAFQAAKRDSAMLVDGGVVNNFPTDVAKNMGADIIIGVDIQDDKLSKDKLETFDGVFNQMVKFLMKGKDSAEILCDIIIRPDITGYSVGSFTSEAADTLIRRGKEEALLHINEIRRLKTTYNLQPPNYSRELVENKEWFITDIVYTNNELSFFDQKFLTKNFGLDFPKTYTADDIKRAIDKLYAYGIADLIYFNLLDNATGKTLFLNMTPKKTYSHQIGFKANTHDAAALMFNITQKDYQKWVGLSSLDLELSANPGATIITETYGKNMRAFGVELNVKYQEYNIYDEGVKFSNADLFYTSAKVYTYKTFLNNLYFGMGIQEEYFNGDVFTKNTNSFILSSKTNQFLSNAYTYVVFDNMDNFYFPQKGTRLDVEFSVCSDLSGNTSLSSALLFKMKNVIPLSSNTTFLFDVYSRSMFDNAYPLIKTTFVGGEPYSQYFNHHLPFIGIPPVILADRYTNIGLAGIRFHIAKNQYVSLVYNLMAQGNNYNELNNFLITNGGGVRYSVDSRLGPVEIGIGYAGRYDKPTFSANLGLWY